MCCLMAIWICLESQMDNCFRFMETLGMGVIGDCLEPHLGAIGGFW